MKKTLSIILAALMLACCIPFTAFAAETEVFEHSGYLNSSNPLLSNRTYIIPSGVTMTVESGYMLYIPDGTRLEISEGGTLNVRGSVFIRESGSLYCYGALKNSKNIYPNPDNLGEGETLPNAKVQLRFPDLNDDSINLAGRIKVSYSYVCADQTGEQNVPDGGGEYFVPLNARLKIDAHILEDYETDPSKPKRDKYDDSLLAVSLSDNEDSSNYELNYVKGATAGTGYFEAKASTGCDVCYRKWTKDSDFYTTKKIVLPRGTGYECLPRRSAGNVYQQDSEDNTIYYVKYGAPFSFYVDVDEAYDMSNYEVYIHNGYGWMLITAPNNTAAQADEYGYYNIPAVDGDITVTVTGVMANKTISMIGNILETFKNIFNMLKEFLQGFKEMFSGIKTG